MSPRGRFGLERPARFLRRSGGARERRRVAHDRGSLAERTLHLARRAVLAASLLTCAGCTSVVWYGHGPERRARVELVSSPGRTQVLVGGRARGTYDGVAAAELRFGAGGELAYPALRGGRWFVVAGGREGPPHDGIGALAFSDDGRRLAYAALRGSAWHVVADGREGPPLGALLKDTLRFTPDGRLVYAAQRGRQQQVFVDGVPGPLFDALSRLTLARGRVAYVGRRGRQSHVVADGVGGPGHEAVTELVLTPTRLAYLARERGRVSAFVDGTAGPAHDGAAGQC